MVKARDLLGRGTRGRNAIATIVPLAERQEDGAWTPIANPRALFPPDGLVEGHGVLAISMRDGDLIVFSAATNDRHRAPTKFKAVTARKVAHFLDLPDGEAGEDRRRAVVETGLDYGVAGEWAVRIGRSEIVRVQFARGADGRWRAGGKELARLAVRSFDPGAVIMADAGEGEAALYAIDASAQTGRAVNWASDADYLRAVCSALSAGSKQDAVLALESLASRAGPVDGGLSATGNADVSILDEAVRSEAIARLLRADVAVLDAFLEALSAQPEVKAALQALSEAKAQEEIPRLEAEALSKVSAAWEAGQAERIEQARAAVAELESGELAELDRKRAEAVAGIEAAAEAEREKARAAAAAQADDLRSRHCEEAEELAGRITSALAEIGALGAQQTALTKSIAGLQEDETALAARIEDLRRDGDRLFRRTRAAFGHGDFRLSANEAPVPLDEVEKAAAALGVLSAKGIEQLTRFAILLAAGEVPIVRGPASQDLVEVAAALLAGGRLARLQADPTLVTYDDLWSRPGSSGLTAFGSAGAWAAETGRPVLGLVSGADRSAARFWYPALADARRRGLLPGPFIICVSLDDERSEESEALPKDLVDAGGSEVLDPKAVPFLPWKMSLLLAEGRDLDLSPPKANHAADALLIAKHGAMSANAALRLSRIHAAARAALGEERGSALAAELAATVASAPNLPPTPASPVMSSLAANA